MSTQAGFSSGGPLSDLVIEPAGLAGAPLFQRPDLFDYDYLFNTYRCKICVNAGWVSSARAKEHESSDTHIRHTYRLEPPFPVIAGPSLFSSDPPSRDGVRHGSTPYEGLHVSPDLLDPLPPSSPWHSSSPNFGDYEPFGQSVLPDEHHFESDQHLNVGIPDDVLDPLGMVYAEPDIQSFALGNAGSGRVNVPPTAVSGLSSGPDDSYAEAIFGWDSEDEDNDRDPVYVNPFDSDDEDPLAKEDLKLTQDEHWWPWKNKEHCMMDLLCSFPRAVFSETECDASHWFAMKLGSSKHVPSAHIVKKHREDVLGIAGSQPRESTSTHGNVYTTADLTKLLAHEVLNPLVRPFLRFYPEEGSPEHSEAWHGRRWKDEVDANLCAPMARAPNGQDFFVEEPALVNIHGTPAPVPVWVKRWYARDGALHACVHPLSIDHQADTFVINGEETLDVPLSSFAMNFVMLNDVHQHYSLPPPTAIQGIRQADSQGVVMLESLSVLLPNPWRTKAKGRRVLAMPIWLYCDDTSGNSTKRWNRHDSFLFILAGLLQAYSLLPYNIHFLSTSTIATPLEMLEAIAAMFKLFQKDGVDAWDCILREDVLLLPWVLAGLGDKPMQSEFCSHIGLSGKHFCRVCLVRARDNGKVKNAHSRDINTETAQVLEIMRVGEPRSREHTLTSLRSQHSWLSQGIPTRAATLATETGVKDKHLDRYHARLVNLLARRQEKNRLQGKHLADGAEHDILHVMKNRSFEDMINPIFSVPNIDPCTDTPVKILHVVLLGIVNLEVSELGLPRLRGITLVQYAKSLGGRDFRIILQIAPAILQGLLPPAIWDAWIALCRVGPLLFQPRIPNVSEYTSHLRVGINDLLMATAIWNARWFGKPKFHILLHLPDHVLRFAPPLIMATEGFESYNAVIRMRSIHSNCQAPSKDIAAAMSFLHAARHLASGGW
ncbi:hypothetical protein BC834DRAFT_847348, partial [Gloeopeniophorella convolvens]